MNSQEKATCKRIVENVTDDYKSYTKWNVITLSESRLFVSGILSTMDAMNCTIEEQDYVESQVEVLTGLQ